jgi:sulfatase maturation enzyme AslB (radical SAM superfamily)
MKVLCLGNNHSHTDELTSALGLNHGLITDTSIELQDGYYHTSILDLSLSEILDLADRFDSVVVLDQPIELWNHPTEFHKTQETALQIGNKVSWQNAHGKDQVQYWKNLVADNKSFCIFPFIELLVENGHTNICCRSNTPIVDINKLENFLTDNAYQKIRQSMINGKPLPNYCNVCYKTEDNGIQSARQEETVEWALKLNLTSTDDLKTITDPVYYEVRPSNKCNLMCRMCMPKFSSLIEREQKDLGLIPEEYTESFSDFDIVQIENVMKLYVAGGEPTAMPEFYKFLRKCIDQKHTDFEFIVNTNAVKISSLLLDLGKQFSNLQYTVSIDGYKLANDYTRWRSQWDPMIANVKKLQKNGHSITFNTTLSLYTIFDYTNLIEFLDTEFPGCLVHGQFANNIWPFVFNYSLEQISKLERIKNTNIYKNNTLFKSFIDGVISLAKSSKLDQPKLSKFFNYNDQLDKSRNSCLNNFIPELENLRTLVGEENGINKT